MSGEETSSRFDPIPNKDYGECVTCGIKLATKAEADDHRARTFQGPVGRSHATRSLNPERSRRIEIEVYSTVGDAIDRALEEVYRLVDNKDATYDEIKKALRTYPDFGDAWEEDYSTPEEAGS